MMRMRFIYLTLAILLFPLAASASSTAMSSAPAETQATCGATIDEKLNAAQAALNLKDHDTRAIACLIEATAMLSRQSAVVDSSDHSGSRLHAPNSPAPFTVH